MNFFSQPPPKDILIEQVKDTLGIIKVRALVFPVCLILSAIIKVVAFFPIPNLFFLIFGYHWLATLFCWYLIKKWENTPKAMIALDIGKPLFLLEIVLNLFIIYYLSPLFISFFGSAIWLAVFFYMFYSSASPGPVGYSFSRGYVDTCFILSLLCCGIVFFWEYFGIVPVYASFPFLPGFLYQRLTPSLILFLVVSGVFSAARGFNSEVWNKFREATRRLSQKTGELKELNEELEKRVEERTKESEEAKTVLEIKVEARTKELKELAGGLEDEVKRRTKEIQERMEELERFQKLTIGRELKMVALKEEIKRLEEELEKLRKHESRIY